MRPYLDSFGVLRLFLLCLAVIATTLFASAQSDVTTYGLDELADYVQTDASTVIADPTQPYQFGSVVMPASPTVILPSSTLTTPAGGAGTITPQTSDGSCYFEANFSSLAAMNAAFPTGSFAFSVNTSTPNSYIFHESLPSGSFPAAPQITSATNASWTGGVLQVTDITQAVALTWPAFTATKGAVFFRIDPVGIAENFASNGTSTGYTIQANTLAPNTTYVVILGFSDNSLSPPNNPSGPSPQVGYESNLTFILQTGTPGSSKTTYQVGKTHVLVQTSNSAPVSAAASLVDVSPYNFTAQSPVVGTTSGPGAGSPYTLDFSAYKDKYVYTSGPIATVAALNSAYPDGSYTLADGNSVNLTGDVYPNASTPPQVTMVNGAKPTWDGLGRLVLNPAIANTLTWTAFTGSNSSYTFATGGSETVEIEPYIESNNLIKMQSGIGQSSSTAFNSLVIPAGTLTQGNTYIGYIKYILASDVSHPSANVLDAAGYGTETGFEVVASAGLAPASINGRAVILSIKGGTSPFAKTGSYRFLPSATDDTYVVIGVSGVSDSDGTFDYSVTGTNTASIPFNNSNNVISDGFISELTFTTPTTGSFQIVSATDSSEVFQTGTFSVYDGQAPTSIQGWSFAIQIQNGTAPFASTGHAEIVTSQTNDTYQIIGGPGVESSNGTYTYNQASFSSSSVALDDSVIGPEYTQTFSWSSATQGAYVADDGNGDIQAGTFTATPPPAPVVGGTLTATGQVGVSFNYQITATGVIDGYAATGLPTGLVVDSGTGAISGTPMEAGIFKVTISAANGNTGKATLVLTIAKGAATVTLGNLTATYSGTAQPATATTSPVGLTVTFTYNGKPTLPVNAGSYTVIGTVNNADYQGSSTSQTLTISPAATTVNLGNLNFVYTGKADPATATTLPAKLDVTFTYNGLATAPILVGSYHVVGTINNANYTGSANGPLVISPTAPLVTTSAATLISATSATLNSLITTKGAATTVSFQYGTSTAYTNTTLGQSVAAGTTSVPFSTGIDLLTPQTIYHYRVVATNTDTPALTAVGLDRTFTTLAAPVFGVSPASYLGASDAEVALSVIPNGVATSVYFQYSTTAGFSSFLQTAAQSIGSGNVAVTVYGLFPGLLPNTPYYYRMVTTSAAGTFMSDPATLTTLSFDTTLVAQKGDFAVGASGPMFASFGNPAVNVNDHVAFAGTLTLATGSVTAANDIGIWTDNSGTRQLIAQIGTNAPGTAANFLTLSDPVFNNNDAVAFRGTLNVARALAATATGIWSTSGGSLALVAQEGSPAPGTGGTFATFTSLGLSDSGGAIILATLNAAAGVTASNDMGIWEGNSTADLHLILQLGTTVGGKTITKLTFLPTENTVNGQTRGFNSTSGDIVCGATFSDKTTGIVEVVSGTPQLVALSASTIDAVTGAMFSLFDSPAINANDHTAFQATLTTGTGGVTTSNNVGIWADDTAGTRQLIARIGNGLAPGTTANFLTLSDPVYDNNEAVAFRGTLNVARAQAATATGIWCTGANAASLALVAQQGITQASGCPAGATFSGFTELALADQGGIIVLATLNTNSVAGVSATNNLGIWAVDTTGTLQLIVRTGDVLNGKTVTGLAFLPAETYVDGQTRSFAQGNGDLVYLATFSDKSTAIFNVVFP